jgi:hypothetical protein
MIKMIIIIIKKNLEMKIKQFKLVLLIIITFKKSLSNNKKRDFKKIKLNLNI